MEVPLGLSGFADETPAGHALVLLGGAVAFAAGYLAAAALLFGGVAALDAGSATPRRLAGVFGSLACWGLFALAFVRARGGPVLDALVYPIACAALVPLALRWALFGPDVAGLLERFGFVLLPVGPLVAAAAVTLPGLVFFASLLALWSAALDESRMREWEQRHLEAEFYEEFVAKPRRKREESR